METEVQREVMLSITGVDIGVILGLLYFTWNQIRLSKKHSNKQTEFETTVNLKLTELEKSINEKKEIHDLKIIDMEAELAAYKGSLEVIQNQRMKDYLNVLEKIKKIELDFTKANAQQTETLTKLMTEGFEKMHKKIDDDRRETSGKIAAAHKRIDETLK